MYNVINYKKPFILISSIRIYFRYPPSVVTSRYIVNGSLIFRL